MSRIFMRSINFSILILSLYLLLTGSSRIYILALTPVNLIKTVDTSKFTPVSPDPAGLEYIPQSDAYFLTDSEVDEMPAYFKGKNVFQYQLSGTQSASFSTISFSNEPTGMAFNPLNQHLFISDDNLKKIFEIGLGTDQVLGTVDDTVRSFSTTLFGSNDPEGLAYGGNKLFIADGLGSEIYVISPGPNGIFDGRGDDAITHFDTSVLGQADPEGIAYNSDQATLFIVSNNGHRKQNTIAEVTILGGLRNTLDISFLNAVSSAGLAYGPGSNNPLVNNLFIVARGVDNNVDPAENDGKMYEISLGTSNPTISPILTQTPTNTIPPGSTQLEITVLLHGIGNGGDNVNPQAVGNMNPSRTQRPVSIEFFAANNVSAGVKTGTVTYSSTEGSFKGIIDAGSLNSGIYTARVLTANYLGKYYPGIINLSKSTLNNLPSLSLVAGDSNSDNNLSILDYNIILDCYADLTLPRSCPDNQKELSADLTDDGAVNQFDYNLFLRELSVQGGV